MVIAAGKAILRGETDIQNTKNEIVEQTLRSIIDGNDFLRDM